MLKISRLTDYAVVTLTALADSGEQSATLLAQRIGLSQATVAKVLKQLGRAGIVASARGVAGGYRLARPLDEIDIASVIAAIDGPIKLTQCIGHSAENPQDCSIAGHCAIAGRWNPVNAAVASALQGVSLAQLAGTPVNGGVQ